MTTTTRLDYLLLGASWLVLLIFVGLLLIPEGGVPMLKPHPDFAVISHSTHQITQHPAAFILASGLAFAIIFLMGVLVLMGNRKHNQWGKISHWFIAGMLIYALCWCCMLVAYYHFQQAQDHAFWGGFPIPTAWMIYAIWFWPVAPMGVYYWFFRSWVWRSSDEKRFQTLVQQTQSQEHG